MPITKRPQSLLFVVICMGLLSLTTTNAISKEGSTKKEATSKNKPVKLKESKLGETRNVHTFGKTILCGQPKAADFAEAKKRGVKIILNVRTKREVKWNEKAAAEKIGLEFYHVPFGGNQLLNDKVFEKILPLLANQKKKPLLFHCGSANRVGAVWAAHRALNDGLTIEQAFKEAKEVGLRSPKYAKISKAYILKQQAKKKHHTKH
ncbi:hypothetical protein MNBD_PLANCTO02-31 [hydrothermal vent metagenome]|uniref:Beta-lactamase hydrolase-like protein phosphatase-like domain-containing protein n=1 Tax=hydrothermal vent metagenome TaxID=652676 RepID=A0A3B1DG52_9ZZZZ